MDNEKNLAGADIPSRGLKPGTDTDVKPEIGEKVNTGHNFNAPLEQTFRQLSRQENAVPFYGKLKGEPAPVLEFRYDPDLPMNANIKINMEAQRNADYEYYTGQSITKPGDF